MGYSSLLEFLWRKGKEEREREKEARKDEGKEEQGEGRGWEEE